MKDILVQRWGIDFNTIEDEWTMSEYICMIGAVIISSEKGRNTKGTSAREYTDRQVAMNHGNKSR